MNRERLARTWPQFALHIAIDGAHLYAPTDAEASVLAKQAAEPNAVLPGADSHFVTWIEGRGADEVARQRIARIHANRDLVKRPGWTLDLAIVVSDQPVGIQSLSGFDQWPHRRVVSTTSWLLAPFQRCGLGTRSRAAVLELAFAHLRAESAKSWVLEANHASASVSTKLGYDVIDRHEITEYGRSHVEHVYELTRHQWWHSRVRRDYAPVITNAQPLVELLEH